MYTHPLFAFSFVKFLRHSQPKEFGMKKCLKVKIVSSVFTAFCRPKRFVQIFYSPSVPSGCFHFSGIYCLWLFFSFKAVFFSLSFSSFAGFWWMKIFKKISCKVFFHFSDKPTVVCYLFGNLVVKTRGGVLEHIIGKWYVLWCVSLFSRLLISLVV